MNIFRKFELQTALNLNSQFNTCCIEYQLHLTIQIDISNCLVTNKTWLPLKSNSRLVKSEIQFGHAGKYDR